MFEADDRTSFCTCEGHIGTRNLPRASFRADRRNHSGLQSHCRECENRRRVEQRKAKALRTVYATYGLRWAG